MYTVREAFLRDAIAQHNTDLTDEQEGELVSLLHDLWEGDHAENAVAFATAAFVAGRTYEALNSPDGEPQAIEVAMSPEIATQFIEFLARKAGE